VKTSKSYSPGSGNGKKRVVGTTSRDFSRRKRVATLSHHKRAIGGRKTKNEREARLKGDLYE